MNSLPFDQGDNSNRHTVVIPADTNNILCACVVCQVPHVFDSLNLIFPIKSNSAHRGFTVSRTCRTLTLAYGQDFLFKLMTYGLCSCVKQMLYFFRVMCFFKLDISLCYVS
jgi:hypothetical protein